MSVECLCHIAQHCIVLQLIHDTQLYDSPKAYVHVQLNQAKRAPRRDMTAINQCHHPPLAPLSITPLAINYTFAATLEQHV